MATISLSPAALISAGRFLQRVDDGGVEKVQHATDKTIAGGGAELIIGVSGDDDVTDASTGRPIEVFLPGQVRRMEAGGAIARTDIYLTTDAVGRVVTGPTIGTDKVLALNVHGNTAAQAGDYIYVFTTLQL